MVKTTLKSLDFFLEKKEETLNCYIVEFFYIYWYWKKTEYYTDTNYCYVLINLMYPNESVYKNCKIPQHKFCGICMVRIGLLNSVSLSHWFTIWCLLFCFLFNFTLQLMLCPEKHRWRKVMLPLQGNFIILAFIIIISLYGLLESHCNSSEVFMVHEVFSS